ncbi:MAG: SDR family NAD(P)-dependent oxidoreductase [Planctomycetota bacterium]
MARELSGKTILITGGSSGIGAATAIEAARRGMHVSLMARRVDKLKEVAERVSQAAVEAGQRVRVHFFSGNVAQPEDVKAWLTDAWDALGRADVLFANAGYGVNKPVLEHSEAEHRELFEVNYWGTVHTLRYGVPRLEATGDGLRHVLVCSSAASEIGLPGFGPYSATKGAQDLLAGALRAERSGGRMGRKQRDGGYGLSVTTVHPVGTKTAFFDVAAAAAGGSSPDTAHPPKTNTPGALEQTPEHVARAVLKAVRRPKPEVWPLGMARWAMALGTLWPGWSAWMMRRHWQKTASVA